MNVREAVRAATAILAADRELVAEAGRDAELLLMHRLSVDRAALKARPERELAEPVQREYDASVRRRLTHEPMQYILGEQEFYGLTLKVTPAVLIPRPETECLVEAVLGAVEGNQPVRILDVGTGSGAIAIALAAHLPQARVVAADVSPAALEVATHNAQLHGVGSRITMLASDLLRGVGEQRFDVIVSNPPYIPLGDRSSLHPQVREYEPAQALFAGADGLDIYRSLIPQAQAALLPGGLLALEIGFGQRHEVSHLLAGWDDVQFCADLQGIPRVALARRPGDQGSAR